MAMLQNGLGLKMASNPKVDIGTGKSFNLQSDDGLVYFTMIVG